ncbi:MAG: MBL fold metallo-hydrolase [Eubacteriales bacterium]|nr:MBL fold metallo-hydrolase [Eubacteriales bacterium]
MKNMTIRQCVVGPVYTNCYFLMNQETKELLIVDPGDMPQKIIAMAESMQAVPTAILLTHGHFDHILAADEIRKKYKIPVYASKKEEKLLLTPYMNLSQDYGMTDTLEADVFLTDDQAFEAAGFHIQMIATPGHTSGSCCYYFAEEEILVSGDMLFCGSVGRTDFPTGSMGEITASLHKLLKMLPDQTAVLPGHGDHTTIEYEKRYNPFV